MACIRRLILALAALVAACEQQATPFPVDQPAAETFMPPAGVPQSDVIRYALAANTQGFIPEIDLLQAAAQVEQLTTPVNTADLGTRFDLIAAFGIWPSAQSSPTLPRAALIINPGLPPLDNPALAQIVRAGLDPAEVMAALDIPGVDIAPAAPGAADELRLQLAALGWPDGFDLTFAHPGVPGVDLLAEQLARLNITLRQIPYTTSHERLHLLLITWTEPEEREAWANLYGKNTLLVDLYSLPISYWAVPGLELVFTPGGWPLPIGTSQP